MKPNHRKGAWSGVFAAIGDFFKNIVVAFVRFDRKERVIFIILALYFGEFLKFYVIFWWWDLFLHFAFGCYGVIIFLHLLKGIVQKTNNISIRRFAIFSAISAFCFSITLGTLWEIAEFLCDYFLKTNTVNGGLEDTATDLMVKVVGAFITCVILYNTKLKKVKIN